jgi:hypothetical protein
MKAKPLYFCSLGPWLIAAVVFFAPAYSLKADGDGKKKNPTSKLYVADVEGESSINTGDKIDDLTKKSVYSAEGTTIETKPDANNALVLSNGTGVFFDPDTKLEIKRFLQEPFTPNRNDLEVEPSVSQTSASMPHGTVALCTSKMVAGSSMVYTTPQASVSIRGRKVVMESSGDTTTVSLIEGDVTVRGDLTGGGESLKPGQQAIITRKSPSEPPVIKIQAIPKDQMKSIEDKVSMACMARKTVYFEQADKETNEIVPRPVIPEPAPPSVSPSSIP